MCDRYSRRDWVKTGHAGNVAKSTNDPVRSFAVGLCCAAAEPFQPNSEVCSVAETELEQASLAEPRCTCRD